MEKTIFRIPEMLFLSPWRKDFRFFLKHYVGDLSEDANIEKMVDLLFSRKGLEGINAAFYRFEDINVTKDADLVNIIKEKILFSDRSLGAVFKIILESIAEENGYDRFCSKFPMYLNFVPDLFQWHPDCKVLHITRDPRAIAMSKKNDPGGTGLRLKKHPKLKLLFKEMNVVSVVVQYIWSSRMHKRYQRDFPNYRHLQYEDLLQDPENVWKDVCAFIEIDFRQDMLNLEKGDHDHQPSSHTLKRVREIDPSAGVRWKNIINPVESAFVSRMTAGSMKRFEYLSTDHPIFLNSLPKKNQ